MIKLAKQRDWVETVLDTIEDLNVNKTKRHLTFESQVSQIGTPVVTVLLPKFKGDVEGDVFKHTVATDIWVVERKDGDYEALIDSIVNALEGSAYPDFYEAGDSSHFPATLMDYSGEVWEDSADTESGNIIIRITITVFYKNISVR